MSIQKIKSGIIEDSAILGFKNQIINGDFNVWQRGTTLSATGLGEQRIADRWQGSTGAGTGQATFSRQTASTGDEVISPSRFYYRHTQTVQNTSNARLAYTVEGVHTLAGKTITLSFYAKSNVAINGSDTQLHLIMQQQFGSGGTPSETVNINTPGNPSNTTSLIRHVFGNLTTSWKRYSVTLQLPSVYGKTLGTNNNDLIYFEIRMPNQNSATPTYIIDFAQFQLEEGDFATPFERRPYGTELALCQRYYWRMTPVASFLSYGSGFNGLTTAASCTIHYPVVMRGVPTLQTSATASHYVVLHGAVATTCSAVPEITGANQISAEVGRINFPVASGLTVGQGSMCASNGASGFLAFQSEL
jgi:hypothetical protein